MNTGTVGVGVTGTPQEVQAVQKPGKQVIRVDNSAVEVVHDSNERVVEIRYPNGSQREMRYNDDGTLCFMKSYPGQIFLRSEASSMWTDTNGRQWNIKDINVNSSGDIIFDTMQFREIRSIDGRVELHFPNGTTLVGRDFEGKAYLDKTVYSNATREFGYDNEGQLNKIVEPSGRVWIRTGAPDENGVADWTSNDRMSWRGKVVADIYTTEVRAYSYNAGAVATVSGTSVIRDQFAEFHADIIVGD